MKKIFICLFSLVLCFSLAGCNMENNKKSEDNININENEKITLNNLEEKIKNLGISLEKVETVYAMVGAKDGYKLQSGDAHIEVYQFDESSEAYKNAQKNQQLLIESMNYSFDAKVQNGYAYIIDQNFPEYDKVILLLENLK